MTTLQAAVSLAALVGVLTINGIRQHFAMKFRKDARHLAARRGLTYDEWARLDLMRRKREDRAA